MEFPHLLKTSASTSASGGINIFVSGGLERLLLTHLFHKYLWSFHNTAGMCWHVGLTKERQENSLLSWCLCSHGGGRQSLSKFMKSGDGLWRKYSKGTSSRVARHGRWAAPSGRTSRSRHRVEKWGMPRREPHTYLEKSIVSRGNSKCKCPEVEGAWLAPEIGKG